MKEAMKQIIAEIDALPEGLEGYFSDAFADNLAKVRKALAQPEQEPVAWMFEDDEDNGHKTFRQTPPSPEVVAYLAKWNRPAWVPIYTTPPKRTEQEPVAFKIYKPTPPRHATPNVRDAELPWVYDQDPSSGNVASMWVTPVQTLKSKK